MKLDMASSQYCSDSKAKTKHFFKIILSNSHTKLMIPRKFVRKYGKNLDARILLKVPNGLVWPVDLERHNGEVWLQNGWTEFARFYSLQFGHLLVFEYRGHCDFSVLIFDPSATEIDYPTNLNFGESSKVRKREIDDSSSSDSDIIRPRKKTVKKFARKDASHEGVWMPKLQQEKTKLKDSGSATEEAKARALASAEAFKSNKPSFVIAMKKSHVDGKRRGMVVRKAFEKSYQMWKNDDQVILQFAGKTWLVYCDIKGNGCRLRRGWDRFVRDNLLTIGDVCVFELINASRKLLQVFIFRAAKETNCKGSKILPRVRSEAEEARVLTSVNAFTSKYPFFRVKLYPSSLSGGSLSLPKKFVGRYITKDSCNVTLQISDGRAWLVKCAVYNSCTKFSIGWKIFARAHHLAAGDVCVFELIDCSEKLLNVVIFRNKSSNFK